MQPLKYGNLKIVGIINRCKKAAKIQLETFFRSRVDFILDVREGFLVSRILGTCGGRCVPDRGQSSDCGDGSRRFDAVSKVALYCPSARRRRRRVVVGVEVEDDVDRAGS
jgi:hypothetical protein